MKFKYSKILIASSLAGALFALTYCSPNTPSISKEVLLHDRAMGNDPASTDPQGASPGGSSAPQTLTTASTLWLDETAYESRIDDLASSEKVLTLSEENHSDAALLQSFEKTGKITLILPDALPQQISLVLKIDADNASDESQISLLSSTSAGQIPMSVSAQGGQTIISLDLSAMLENPGVVSSLNELEALSVTYQIRPASQ
jgi:hypothetical protein